MKALAIAMAIPMLGCAAPECKPVTIVKQQVVEKPAAPRVVYIKAAAQPRGTLIMRAEKASEPSQNKIAAHGTIPAIQQLIFLRAAVKRSFAPLKTPGHTPTDQEVQQAVVAYGALQAFINAPHATRKTP